MSRALVVCKTDADRQRAAAWAMKAPEGTRIEFKAVKRTMAQNDRMWSMLTDVATQVRWHGQRLTAEEWKLLFLDALDRETRTVPSLDGQGVVSLGRSSSDLSRQEMSDLQELIAAFGAERGVKFKVFDE